MEETWNAQTRGCWYFFSSSQAARGVVVSVMANGIRNCSHFWHVFLVEKSLCRCDEVETRSGTQCVLDVEEVSESLRVSAGGRCSCAGVSSGDEVENETLRHRCSCPCDVSVGYEKRCRHRACPVSVVAIWNHKMGIVVA